MALPSGGPWFRLLVTSQNFRFLKFHVYYLLCDISSTFLSFRSVSKDECREEQTYSGLAPPGILSGWLNMYLNSAFSCWNVEIPLPIQARISRLWVSALEAKWWQRLRVPNAGAGRGWQRTAWQPCVACWAPLSYTVAVGEGELLGSMLLKDCEDHWKSNVTSPWVLSFPLNTKAIDLVGLI